jgi:hypothetical protein
VNPRENERRPAIDSDRHTIVTLERPDGLNSRVQMRYNTGHLED